MKELKTQFGEAWDFLFHPPVAHRGLWSPDGAPENSLGAFQAACQAGHPPWRTLTFSGMVWKLFKISAISWLAWHFFPSQ